jgi:hypothetical protein
MRIAMWIAVDVTPIVEFAVSRGSAEVVCVRRETDAGVEVSVTFSGLRTAQFIAPTEDAAHARADEIRRAWEALGYVAG